MLSLPVSFAGPQLGPLFPALLAAHPHLRLELRFEERFADLVGEGVDLAIRAGSAPPESPFVIARKLALIDRVLCASPAFVQAHGPLKSPGDLASRPCVLQGAQTTWSFEGPKGPLLIKVAGALRANNISALREAALAGLGVARLPLWVVDDELRAGRLVQLLPQARMPVIEVYGVFHAGARGSRALRAVLDYFLAELPRRTRMRPP